MPSVSMSSKTGGVVPAHICWAAYFAAAQAAHLFATNPKLRPAFIGAAADDPIAQGLYGDVWATLVIYVLSFVMDNTSIYDPYWPLAPMALTAWWARTAAATAPLGMRQLLAVGVVWVWALRLLIGVPWSGWFSGLQEEDWRYAEIRAKTRGGLRYWAASLLSLHLTPTLMVFATLRPIGLVILAPSASVDLSAGEALAVGVCAVAIVVEGVADEQLRRFREVEANTGGGCESGLWRWCRHPNYLGEVLFHAGALCLGVIPQFLAFRYKTRGKYGDHP